MSGPRFIDLRGDVCLVEGRPLSALGRDELEQLARDLAEDNAALSAECSRLGRHVSAGFDYRIWREKPPEDRKAGAPHAAIPGATE